MSCRDPSIKNSRLAMRNLIAVAHTRTEGVLGRDDVGVALAVSSDDGRAFVLAADGSIVAIEAEGQACDEFASVGGLLGEAGDASPVGFAVVAEQEMLLVAGRGGALVKIPLAGDDNGDDNDDDEPEIIGELDTGIAGLELRPDGEALAVATGSGTLMLFTIDLEVIDEVDLSRVAPNPDAVASLSWRADGDYVSFLGDGGEGGRPVLEVLDRSGELSAHGEATPGLRPGPLAWSPDHSIIAATTDNQVRSWFVVWSGCPCRADGVTLLR